MKCSRGSERLGKGCKVVVVRHNPVGLASPGSTPALGVQLSLRADLAFPCESLWLSLWPVATHRKERGHSLKGQQPGFI